MTHLQCCYIWCRLSATLLRSQDKSSLFGFLLNKLQRKLNLKLCEGFLGNEKQKKIVLYHTYVYSLPKIVTQLKPTPYRSKEVLFVLSWISWLYIIFQEAIITSNLSVLFFFLSLDLLYDLLYDDYIRESRYIPCRHAYRHIHTSICLLKVANDVLMRLKAVRTCKISDVHVHCTHTEWHVMKIWDVLTNRRPHYIPPTPLLRLSRTRAFSNVPLWLLLMQLIFRSQLLSVAIVLELFEISCCVQCAVPVGLCIFLLVCCVYACPIPTVPAHHESVNQSLSLMCSNQGGIVFQSLAKLASIFLFISAAVSFCLPRFCWHLLSRLFFFLFQWLFTHSLPWFRSSLSRYWMIQQSWF